MRFRCHGCGTVIDAARTPPFRCPGRAPGDDIDHVLVPEAIEGGSSFGTEANPFLRYRTLLSPYRVARSAGLSDAAWGDVVETLDSAVLRTAGRGFRVTPLADQARLADALGFTG